jgi:hypothetical protein
MAFRIPASRCFSLAAATMRRMDTSGVGDQNEWAATAVRRLLVTSTRRAADDLEAAVRRLRQWAW